MIHGPRGISPEGDVGKLNSTAALGIIGITLPIITTRTIGTTEP